MIMDDRDRLRDWPELSTIPPPIPEVRPNASAVELAKAYMAVALGYHDRIPKMIAALQWLHGAVIGARSEAERARDISAETKEVVVKLQDSLDNLVLEAKVKKISSHELDQFAAEAEEINRKRDSERVETKIQKAIEIREGELAKKVLEDQRKTQRTIVAGVITTIILSVLAFIAGRLLK